MNTFDEQREGTGTHEWAEVTENISRGCPHDCLYCYAAQNAKRFKLRDRADWKREELTKRAYITSYPARDGVIMFHVRSRRRTDQCRGLHSSGASHAGERQSPTGGQQTALRLRRKDV